MSKRGLLVLSIGTILFFQLAVFAESPRKLVGQGNSAYRTGHYDEAIEAYNLASVEAPEDARIYFNKGTALYKKEDYKAAKEAFEQAALKSQDLSLEAKAKFNLGNCEYKEAERLKDNDLKKSLEAFGNSIRYYQEALELDPTLKEAAENIEMTRLVMKTILDEIKKQEEAQKQKQAAADKLKELIKRQQGLREQGNDISKKLKQKEAHESLLDQVTGLAEQQKTLASDTREVKENIQQQQQQQQNPQQQNPPASVHPSIPHLEDAVKSETSAGENLDKNNVAAAIPDQEDALDALEKALEAMNQENKGQCQNKKGNQQQQQQGQQQQQQDQGQKQQQQKSPEQASDQDKKQDSREQKAMAQLPDDAQNILDEEKENKKKRNLPAGSGYRRVDRDW